MGDIINSQFPQRRITLITSTEIRYTLVTNMKTYEKKHVHYSAKSAEIWTIPSLPEPSWP